LPERSFGGRGAIRGGLEPIEEPEAPSCHADLRDGGGREWESNPPRTVSQPFPDLKSGRPTRNASLPDGV
jgi:hypothetical protein